MSIFDSSFENLLPSYLLNTDKSRIKKGLEQFFLPENRQKEKVYVDFYLLSPQDYLMQSDVLNSIRSIDWDDNIKDYITGFTPAVLLSNSCDISTENIRGLNKKEVLFAPIVPLDEIIKDYKESRFSVDQISTFQTTLKNQEYTNLFYLPPNEKNKKEYVVYLDKIFWHPVSELKKVIDNLNESRFISLSHFGHYLFITKLSIHLCRVPEELERRD